jgi:hypothetical protein
LSDHSLGDIAARLNARIAVPARALLGEPNRALSTKTQLRFGSKGSVAVEIAGPNAGKWYDHEAGVGNRWLREAFENRIPIIYFLGIAPGRYQAIISGWDAKALKARVAFGVLDEEALAPPETAPTIYNDINQAGVISYPEACRNPIYARGTSFEGFLSRRYTGHAFTLETPTGWSLSDRVNTHLTFLKVALRHGMPSYTGAIPDR